MESDLHFACQRGNLEEVRALLDCRASVNSTSAEVCFCGAAPLHVTTNLAIIKELLDRGADAEKTNKSGDTPLLQACRYNENIDIVTELLNRGANIEAVDRRGQTPLVSAVRSCCVALVGLLLSRGASVNARNNDGNTALHLACLAGDGVDLLLDHGADINAVNNDGQTSLAFTISKCYHSMVEPLLARGACVNVADKYGYTPLHYAYDLHNISALLDAGADIDSRSNDGETALEMACGSLDKEKVELLLSRGAEFPDLDHLIAKSWESRDTQMRIREFVQFLEEYVSSMHPVMK